MTRFLMIAVNKL